MKNVLYLDFETDKFENQRAGGLPENAVSLPSPKEKAWNRTGGLC